METTIALPALRRTAELAPHTADAAARTVEVMWSTGARVRRSPLFGEPYDEELSLDPAHVRLDRLNAGAPFLRVHELADLDAVLGSVVPGSARIDNGRGIACVRLSERADVEPLWRDILAGHIRAVSIGYQVHRFDVSKPDGGRELWRAVDWTPFEVSAVPVGADPAAGFRSQEPRASQALEDCIVHRRDAPALHHASPLPAASPASQEGTDPMPEARADKPDAAAETQATAPAEADAPNEDAAVTEHPVAETRAQTQTIQTQAAQTPQSATADEVATRAREAERERVSTIYALTGRLNIERGFADDLVKRGSGLDEARRLILDHVAAQSEDTRTFPHVSVPLGGQDEHVTRREAIQSALLHRFQPERYPLSEAARAYRSLSLMELSRDHLAATGERVRGLSRDEVASRALHSSSDFPAILAGVTHKTLRDAYQEAPRTFLPIARRATASDFKEIHRLQLGEAPTLEKVNEAGEFRHGTVGEGRERYRLETWGKIFGITRQVIINDDLDAFTRIPALFGNAAARLESDLVWGVFTANPAMADGQTLFHANHKNLAGSGTELTVSAIGKARAAMARQTGVDGKTVLNIRPSFLVVPVSLELAAEQLVAQNLVPAQAGHVVPQSIRSLAVIAEPRLDPASGAVPWYLVASPASIDTLEYAHLEGQDGVYIETRNGFDVDGVSIKARLDFGVKAIDWRGLFKNPGVALS